MVRSADCFLPPSEVETLLARDLTADPVFGRLNGIGIEDFFVPGRVAAARRAVANVAGGLVLIIGTGAAVVEPRPDVLIYADMARWTIQQRQRGGEIGNLGADNQAENPSLKYKRGFFVDWRAADKLKKTLLPRLDFLLDTNDRAQPKMISGDALRHALMAAVRRPFRVVPFFDPGP
ncbi:MAG: mannose-6-phosphate isomerase, partial [Acidobacteria bacterium]|nr:mannose-6-phosphate isomerase [Acidobacteriota bacterium]